MLSIRSQTQKTKYCVILQMKCLKGQNIMIESNQWSPEAGVGELTALGIGKLFGSRETFYTSAGAMFSLLVHLPKLIELFP